MITRKDALLHPSTMYRQGDGWIVSSWDAQHDCYSLSAQLSNATARHAVGQDNCPANWGGTCRAQDHNHDLS